MRKQLRPLALLTFIAAATAFGSQIAVADTSSPTDRPEARCGQQHQQNGHRGHRYFRKMARELGLTDQQKTQAKALFETNRAQNKPLFSALMTEKHQLRALVQSGSADEAAIRAQAGKVAAAEADLAVKRAQSAKQFLALLTPDQVTKLRAIQAKRDLKFKKLFSGQEAPTE
jgi:periplasmic protein CpxP/Spy